MPSLVAIFERRAAISSSASSQLTRLKPPAPFRPSASHRILQAFRVILALQIPGHFAAQKTARNRVRPGRRAVWSPSRPRLYRAPARTCRDNPTRKQRFVSPSPCFLFSLEFPEFSRQRLVEGVTSESAPGAFPSARARRRWPALSCGSCTFGTANRESLLRSVAAAATWSAGAEERRCRDADHPRNVRAERGRKKMAASLCGASGSMSSRPTINVL